MKHLQISIWLWIAALGFPALLPAQQVSLAPYHTFRLDGLNPAASGSRDLHQVGMLYGQQGFSVSDWNSVQQFIHYQSRPVDQRKRFGWGLQMSNDEEHSERRISINPSIAARVLETDEAQLTLGFSVGIVNWTSDYSRVAVYHRDDALVANGFSFLELNAGIGGKFTYEKSFLRGSAQLMGTQLPGNLLTDRISGMPIRPHGMASAELLASPVYNFWVGPVAFYRNTLNQRDTTLQAAQLDIGLKALFDRQNLWVAGAYRTTRSSLTMGMGLQLMGTDTAFQVQAPFFMDLNFDVSYPVSRASVFGPQVDLGLTFRFAPRRKILAQDSMHYAVTFWKNEGSLNRHRVERLDPNGPESLLARTNVLGRRVELRYEWPDNSYRYIGETPIRKDSLLRKVGFEWIGVDGLMENVPLEIVREALTPSTERIIDPENLEPLKVLTSVGLSCDLRVDAVGAHLGAEGRIYQGELGGNNPTDDTLFIPIVFDDIDTVVAIVRNSYITNLELASLKLLVMRKRLHYEMNRDYGDQFVFLQEGATYNYDEVEGRKIVWIKKLRITCNYTNQQAFQTNRVELKFLRYKKFVVDEQNERWTPREEEEEAEEEQKRKGKKAREEGKWIDYWNLDGEEGEEEAPTKSKSRKSRSKSKETKRKPAVPEIEAPEEPQWDNSSEWELPEGE